MFRTLPVLIVLVAGIAAISSPVSVPALAETTSPTKDVAGEQAGDACIRSSGGTDCCKGLSTCIKMVQCNATLNACKKDKMAKDTTCSGPDCQRCTSDYKVCHDTAVAAIKPVTIECVVDRGSLKIVGTNPNPFPETCSVTCTYVTADKQSLTHQRSNVSVPKESTKADMGSNDTPGKLPLANLATKAICK
jgi:hypothetical protein